MVSLDGGGRERRERERERAFEEVSLTKNIKKQCSNRERQGNNIRKLKDLGLRCFQLTMTDLKAGSIWK
jgi:hypothetical protein